MYRCISRQMLVLSDRIKELHYILHDTGLTWTPSHVTLPGFKFMGDHLAFMFSKNNSYVNLSRLLHTRCWILHTGVTLLLYSLSPAKNIVL